MKILDLAWVSWVLIIASLIAGGAWLGWGFWWLRHNSTEKKSPQCADNNNSQALIRETKPAQQKSLTNKSARITTKPIVFPENPERMMWRPPPRESLLHRQQIKIKLGRPEDRLEVQRPRLTKTPLPIASYSPQVTAKSNQPPLIRIASPDSKIGRKRQGLESLVNLSPHTQEETEDHHDARNS